MSDQQPHVGQVGDHRCSADTADQLRIKKIRTSILRGGGLIALARGMAKPTGGRERQMVR